MIFFVIALLTYILQIVFVVKGNGNIEIDEDHLKREPDCGKLPSKSSSRISNAQESEQQFPWVVFVARENYAVDPNGKYMNCGGAIITKYSVVTAAHCVCGPMDAEDRKRHPDETLKKIYCKGGRRYINDNKNIDMNNLPNEVKASENEIFVGAGHRNKYEVTRNEEFEISYACVHHGYEHNTIDKRVTLTEVDIAIIKTYHQTNKVRIGNPKSEFYSQDSLKRNFDIGPICLAAQNADFRDEVIETVGWGRRYREVQTNSPRPDPKANLHSCTTNTNGPIEHLLKHCSVDYLKMTDWSCGSIRKQSFKRKFNEFFKKLTPLEQNLVNPKDYTENIRIDKDGFVTFRPRHHYPAGYDVDKCQDLWNKADQEVKSRTQLPEFPNLIDEWMESNKIIIVDEKESKDPKNKGKDLSKIDSSTICYRDELFKNQGWCYTEGGIIEKEWGFCDYSCDIMRHRENPNFIKSFVYPEIYHRSTWKIDKLMDEDHCADPSDKAEFIVCSQSILPTIKSAVFHRNQDGSLRLLTITKTKQEDYAGRHPGFQQTCSGDSGSGHWVLNSNDQRHVLVGITFSKGRSDDGIWCGMHTIKIKTTWPPINRWIKKHSSNVI